MRNIYIAIIMVISSSLFAIEYNQYEMKRVHEFSAENGEKDIDKVGLGFAFEGGLSAGGPAIFFDENNFVLADQEKGRTIYLNNDYSFKKIYKKSFYLNSIYFNPSSYFMGLTTEGHIGIFDKTNGWELIVQISVDNLSFLRNSKSAFYHSHILFIHDKDGKLWSIKTPSLDDAKNRKNLLNEEKTLALFKDGDIDGLTIDSEKRLFLNGELQTLDYKTYINYYSVNKNIAGTIRNFNYTYDYLKTFQLDDFLGKDKYGNKYWGYRGAFMVFNNNGGMIDFSTYTSKKSSTTPAVSPSGDIYFMHHGEDKVTLYKIERQW